MDTEFTINRNELFSNGDISTGNIIDYDWVEGISISDDRIRCKNIIENAL